MSGGWFLYRFTTHWACPCGRQHLLYVGKSNDPLRRVNEHMAGKWWRPMVRGWDTLPETYATEQEVLAAERAMILRERPLVNEQHNMGNPCRLVALPPGFAAVEPGRRDRTQIRSRAAYRTARPLRRTVRRPVASRRLAPTLGYAALWATLAVAGWWAVARYLPIVPADHAAGVGALTAGELVAAMWAEQRPRKRRWVRLVLVAGGVAGLVWVLPAVRF